MAALHALSYQQQKIRAADPDPAVRRDLAAHPGVRPEILYYLASDEVAAVRRRIAANPGTPSHADLELARDPDDMARQLLAQKVASLYPTLDPLTQSLVTDYVVKALEILANDRLKVVRQILADALKEVVNAPHVVIMRLAQDTEIDVAEPVLRLSPVLTDEDLREIIGSAVSPASLEVIACREQLSEEVTAAMAARDAAAPIRTLLTNPGAQLSEATFHSLLDRAPDRPEWHSAMVRRPHMPATVAKRLTGFVADSLLEVLRQRDDLEPETVEAVISGVRDRLLRMEYRPPAKPAPGTDRGAPVGPRVTMPRKKGNGWH